ncbi:N-alpha-acetyltransferase [Raphidocelis subcapitata]|uniref:N-alpha-acetyltransferase n=1 Tax=Raphidocelis subcapitata TaxID=307507 RepID=A0A2V0P4G3_9CHLO|nr:N-alpha-acetyltransferase [Raphidocelis subcapitata]|eukprot:GBF94459.1 N-alpha-acetyltransferase [Raphidocelis subcapitata]
MAVATAPAPPAAAPAAAARAAAAAPPSAAPADAAAARRAPEASTSGITYRVYRDEHDLPAVIDLIDKDLSEPYSIFTYRYFTAQWPQLCFLAHDAASGAPCGVVVCKMDVHRGKQMRGYLAMLVVDKRFRGKGVGSCLARMAIQAMIDGGAEEVALEAEVTNGGALALYRALGFVRDKRLHRYYLSGNDAYRLKLQLPLTQRYAERRAREREAILGYAEGGGEGGEQLPAVEGEVA